MVRPNWPVPRWIRRVTWPLTQPPPRAAPRPPPRTAGRRGASPLARAAAAPAATRSAASSATNAGLEMARDVRDKASEYSNRAGKTLVDTIQQNPLLVAGVGLL